MDWQIAVSIGFGLSVAIASALVDSATKAWIKDAPIRPTVFSSMTAGWILILIATLTYGGSFPSAWFSNGTFLFSIICTAIGAVAFDSYYRGVQSGRVSVMASLNSLNAMFLVALCVIFLSVKINEKIVVAVFLAVAGTALSVFHTGGVRKAVGGIPELRFLVVCVPLFTISSLLSIIIMQRIGALWEFLIDRTLFLMFFAIMFRKDVSIALHHPKVIPWKLVAFCAVFGTISGLSGSFGILLGLPSLVIPIAATGAAFTALIGFFVLHERLEPAQKVGLLMVASAVAVASL